MKLGKVYSRFDNKPNNTKPGKNSYSEYGHFMTGKNFSLNLICILSQNEQQFVCYKKLLSYGIYKCFMVENRVKKECETRTVRAKALIILPLNFSA